MRWDTIRVALQQQYGLSRSLLIYYLIPFQQAGLRRLYRQFIRPNDLCFDIGAHVGSRVRVWLRLGARVVAVEPQPHCMQLLRRWYGHWPHVTLCEQAVGATSGSATLWISRHTPTVSTTSQAWQRRVQQTPGFAAVRWDTPISVPVTTLDALIAQYGVPDFCKIDVEGAELDVLEGLSQALPKLSFEYLPATIDIAVACIERLSQLGEYEYNRTVSEWPWLRERHWLTPRAMIAKLERLPRNHAGGDIYTRLVSSRAGNP